MEPIKGRVWVFGDNVDTDQIIPAERLLAANLDHLNDYIFEKVRPGFAQQVRKGDILVAGSLLLVECKVDAKEGDTAVVDVDAGKVEIEGKEYTFPEYPPFITELIRSGGLMNLIREGKFR